MSEKLSVITSVISPSPRRLQVYIFSVSLFLSSTSSQKGIGSVLGNKGGVGIGFNYLEVAELLLLNHSNP